MVKLVIGLGNPGDKYVKTRHNIGFVLVDALHEKHGFQSYSNKFHGQYSIGLIGNTKVILLKPQTYMNLSGRSAQECSHFYKVPVKDIIVLHDELDIELGRVKIKVGGNHAGHNGLKSLDENIGNNYTRLRFGVDRPKRQEVSSYVLNNFREEELDLAAKSVDEIVRNFKDLIHDKHVDFANKYALAMKPPKEKK
jgi:PTH1 family peptidyl-tRNA hydrolase